MSSSTAALEPPAPAASSERRSKVLLIAYACRPGFGSEPGVGWNRAVEAARYFDTWVICEGNRCGPSIRQFEEQHGRIPGLHFVFVPTTRLQRFLATLPGLMFAAYHLWHRRAYRVAVRLHREQRFHLAHQTTYCSYREPGYLWKLDIPFIWGPFGGTQNTPRRFLAFIGLSGAAYETARALVNRLHLRFRRRVRHAAQKAAFLLAANSTNQRDFERTLGRKPKLLLETGLPRVVAQPKPPRAANRPLRILWVGRCTPFKALPLLLEALSQLPANIAFELDILGDGPARRRWQRQIERLGLAPHVTWNGWLPHAEVLGRYEQADLFAFTSLRDTSGTVILEAFAAGTPVLCLDHQGAHDMVTPSSGVKIPVVTPDQVIADLRDAIAELAADPDKLHALSLGAWQHAHDFLWSKQSATMAEYYREAIAAGRGPAR